MDELNDGEENSNPVIANGIEVTTGMNLSSIEKETIDKYFHVFGHKELMLHHAQGLPPFVTENAYKKEEDSFTKTVRKVPVRKIPVGCNVISSHVLYKVKVLDDGSKIVKARIAPHCNKDRERENLKTDSTVCSPVSIRIVLSIAFYQGRNLAKIDFKSAFLQSGQGQLKIFAVKIVDDVPFAGQPEALRSVVGQVSARYNIDTVVFNSM